MVQLWAVRMAVRSRGNQAFKGGRCQLREAGIYSKDREGYNLFQSEDRIE
jgi:peptide methionine sulfoxide reductase MsrB